jgi:dienelactone hydrolase
MHIRAAQVHGREDSHRRKLLNCCVENRSAIAYDGSMTRGFLLLTLIAGLTAAQAAVQTQTIEYKQGDTVCEGVLVYDDLFQGKRSGILVAHQWKGISNHEKEKAELLAMRGHVVLCADVYGKGVRADNPKDASALAAKYKSDRALLRARINAAFDYLRQHPRVNPTNIAAIGYCFGGTTVLELARSGANVKGVVSFHGGLGAPNPTDAKNIKGKVLALHGADDPFVPAEEVLAFQKEMRDAKVDWQLVAYGNAVHSFTDRNAGNDNAKGSAYNASADVRSWREMKMFFDEVLR